VRLGERRRRRSRAARTGTSRLAVGRHGCDAYGVVHLREATQNQIWLKSIARLDLLTSVPTLA
jgi:hypothetical protein